jgi:hypothetical protein
MRLRSFVLNSLLVAGSISITAGAALLLDRWLELGLRHRLASVLETYIQQAEPIMYVYDNQTGWRLNPRTQYHRASFGPFYGLAGFEPFDAKLRVNAEGFIDRDHYLKTPYYRIAFVGNSWLEAVQLQYHERFPPLTEDFVFRLSEHKKVVEVMNFGLSNAAPAQGYGVIKHFVVKYQPEEVWLFVNSWDVRSNSTFDSPPPFGPVFEYVDDTHRELKDIRFGFVDPPAYAQFKRERDLAELHKVATRFGQVMPYFYSEERNAVFDAVWNEMRLTIALIHKTLAASGIRMRLVFMPVPYDVDAQRWDQFRREAAKEVGRELPMDQGLAERRYATIAKDLGVDFISLTPLCKERGVKEIYADHFSAKGSWFVADYLARIIIDSTPPRPLPKS